jgi:hypothetical protein
LNLCQHGKALSMDSWKRQFSEAHGHSSKTRHSPEHYKFIMFWVHWIETKYFLYLLPTKIIVHLSQLAWSVFSFQPCFVLIQFLEFVCCDSCEHSLFLAIHLVNNMSCHCWSSLWYWEITRLVIINCVLCAMVQLLKIQNGIMWYCIIHEQNLYSKDLGLERNMNDAVSAVNFIRLHRLNCTQLGISWLNLHWIWWNCVGNTTLKLCGLVEGGKVLLWISSRLKEIKVFHTLNMQVVYVTCLP